MSNKDLLDYMSSASEGDVIDTPGNDDDEEEMEVIDMDDEEDGEDFPLTGHLRLAVEAGDLNRVKAIVEREHVDVNDCDIEGWSCLLSAAYVGKLDVIEYLIERGANVQFRSERGMDAFMYACHEGFLDIAQYLIDKIDCLDNEVDLDDATVLHMAIDRGHHHIVRLLLENGADLTATTTDLKFNILAPALPIQDIYMVNLLIEFGVNINYDCPDTTVDLLSDLINPSEDKCAEGIALTKCLIENGINIHRLNGEGGTFLTAAAECGNHFILPLLYSIGIDVNHRDNMGWTALMAASFNDRLECVKYLLTLPDIDLHCREYIINHATGWNAMMAACQSGSPEIVEALYNAGASIIDGDSDGTTPVMIAASNGHELATRYLVSVNADINAKENDGHNTVLYAAEKGHLSILRYLVEECHADINHSLTDGRTILDLAKDHKKVIQYLRKILTQNEEANQQNNSKKRSKSTTILSTKNSTSTSNNQYGKKK